MQLQLVAYFGLRENPFGVTPDPRYLFFSETHREALASLINGIDCEFGFQVLVAQPGMGKTTLLFNFLERFRATAHTAFLFQPQLEPRELLQSLLSELGAGSEETSVRKLSEQLNQVLLRAVQERKRVIVVVDEAQNLQFSVLETLRQLSNFETAQTKLMQIVLAGQPNLARILASPELEQLRQRISAVGRLSPLALNETQAYINHRLRTAGYRGLELFTQGAMHNIWERGKGVPRNINTLCFNAMLLAFAGNTKSIDERLLEEAARDLDLQNALADVYRMDPALAVSIDSGKVQPIRETKPPETDRAKPVTIAEPVASPGAISGENRAAKGPRSADGNTGGVGKNISQNPEKGSPPKAEKTVRHEQKLAADTAPKPPAKVPAEPSFRANAAVTRSYHPVAQRRSENGGFWPKALALAAMVGVLTFVLVEKSGVQHSGRAEAKESGLSAAGQSDSASGYSVPAESPASPTDTPTPSSKGARPNSQSQQDLESDKSQEVIVRKFATDAGDVRKIKIFFDQDSAEIGWQYRTSLQQIADALAEDPQASVILEGHTDSSGPEAYNLELSNHRAIAVRDALVNQLHVSSNRLTAMGAGSSDPVQPNSSSIGRAYNRRVAVRFVRLSE